MSLSLLLSALALACIATPHCATMCGCGLARPWLTRGQASSFLAGRMISYVGLGAVAGGTSQTFAHWATGQTPLFNALHWVLMAVMGFSALVLIARARPVLWTTALGEGVSNSSNTFGSGKLIWLAQPQALPPSRAGALWWMVPCGVLYSAVALAYLSGSVWQGMAIMTVFGAFSSVSLGLAGRFQAWVRRRLSEAAMYRVNGVLILLGLGVIGARQAGWLPTPEALKVLGLCL